MASYSTAQFKFDYTCMCHVATFFISLAYKIMHVCAHKIDNVEALMQSTCVCTRCVHNNLHDHACMSVTYMPNLVCMHVDMHNYYELQAKDYSINSMNMFLY